MDQSSTPLKHHPCLDGKLYPIATILGQLINRSIPSLKGSVILFGSTGRHDSVLVIWHLKHVIKALL